MYQTLQSVIYIYICIYIYVYKLLNYIALQRTDSSFSCEIGGKERHAFPFWGTSARKKGTDSSRAQCVHPPVNWISTQKSSQGIESKSTKFDLAAKAPEKLPFGAPNRKPDRLPTSHHFARGELLNFAGMRHLAASTRPWLGSRRLRWCHVAVSHQLPIATEQHLMIGYGLVGMLGVVL